MKASTKRALLLMFLTLVTFGAGRPAAADIAWDLYDRDPSCSPDGSAAAEVVACGSHGIFVLHRGLDPEPPASLPGCTRRFGNREQPLRYLTRRSQPSSGALDELPCAGGSCWTPLAELTPQQPWIAQLDWNNWHGWTVAWTILQAGGGQTPVVAFPFSSSAPQAFDAGGTDDAQVLVGLCTILEAVEAGAVSPPVAVNMSFGRLPDAVAGGCSRDALACQLREVLDHLSELTEDFGRSPTLVAAAGNHRKLLFPASHDKVIATASLDLASLAWGAESSATWESPTDAVLAPALFPGNGLCLQYAGADGSPQGWRAPPGTSYASAFLTGWLGNGLPSGTTARDGTALTPFDLLPSLQTPQLLQRVYGQGSAACAISPDPEAAAPWFVEALAPLPSPLPELSLIDLVGVLNRPTPEPDPCVPCLAQKKKPTSDLVRQRIDDPNARGFGSYAHASVASSDDLSVDLSQSAVALAADGVEILELYLRLEADFYPLVPLRGDYEALDLGLVDAIVIKQFGSLVQARSQPSLVFVLRFTEPEADDPGPFWTSTPIQIFSANATSSGAEPEPARLASRTASWRSVSSLPATASPAADTVVARSLLRDRSQARP